MIATTIATIANPLGVAVGFLIPSLFVENDDKDPLNRSRAQDNILNSLICQAALGTVVAILIVIYFKEKPPTPPSPSAGPMPLTRGVTTTTEGGNIA